MGVLEEGINRKNSKRCLCMQLFFLYFYFVIKSVWMLCTNLRKNKLQRLEYCLDSGRDLAV